MAPPSTVLSATPAGTEAAADPAIGEPAVRIDITGDVSAGWVPTLTVYEDGRVLRLIGEADQIGLRRISDEGVEAVRRELLASGFFERDTQFIPPVPPAHGFTSYTATVRVGDRLVRSVASNAAATPEATAFIALVERVAALEAWLPDEMWQDLHPEPYEARSFWLTTNSSPGVLATYPEPPVFAADVDDVAWALPVPIHEFGAPDPRSVRDFPRFRCGVIAGETAERLLAALAFAGYPKPPPGFSSWQFEFGWRATNGIFWVSMLPLLPDTPPSCEFLPTIG